MSTDTKYYFGVGRRKRATARAKLFSAEELQLTVNKKDPKEYFNGYFYQVLENMFSNLGLKGSKIDLYISGGGKSGQAEAARLAIAKALVAQNPEMKPILRMYGYLTTDVRKVLPKRAGLRKSRKAEQWSKR
jgi:small subunit ribosomal protein S9